MPSTSQTQLDRAFLGTQMFVSNFLFLDSLEYVANESVCHIYHWIGRPVEGGVCNHCERLMQGLTLDDVVARNTHGSLTEDDVVAYVQNGYPDVQNWDEYPLRMTFRINSFLRTLDPELPEPDLAQLDFSD